VDALLRALDDPSRCAIDASDTGTGKTYTSAAIAKRLNLRVVVICPKSVLIGWQRVLEQFAIPTLGIANYEMIKGGRWYTDVRANRTAMCTYFSPLAFKDNTDCWEGITDDMLFIFDEVHRCKNHSTSNARLLLKLADTTCYKLLLSATIADKPEYFAIFARMLGLIKHVDEFRLFRKVMIHDAILAGQQGSQPDMLYLNRKIFPQHGSRMRISDLGSYFQTNRVVADTYKMDDETVNDIKGHYHYIAAVHTEVEAKEALSSCPLTMIIRARQKIEALKVKTMTELVEDHVANGDSVAVFVNYMDTMALLQDRLLEVGIEANIIKGGQTVKGRQSMIDSFNDDSVRVIICQIQSGGAGISLHDTIGVHPRVSIISPSWSAQDLMQSFGRIHRVGGKTPCIQKLIYCHGTVEEQICSIVNAKLVNYSILMGDNPP
jgi:superfamily II DNA or RNA helicase